MPLGSQQLLHGLGLILICFAPEGIKSEFHSRPPELCFLHYIIKAARCHAFSAKGDFVGKNGLWATKMRKIVKKAIDLIDFFGYTIVV